MADKDNSATAEPLGSKPVMTAAAQPPEIAEQAAKQRADELQRLTDAHLQRVQGIHDRHPVPNKPFTKLTQAQQRNWHMRRQAIDKQNKDYNKVVRAACQRHRDEVVEEQKTARAKGSA